MALCTNKTEIKQFHAVCVDAVKFATTNCVEPSDEIKLVLERLEEILDYNLFHEAIVFGPYVAKAYKTFCKDKVNEQDIYLANVFGCCYEMAYTCFTMLDDMMDRSHTRYGKLCWYKKDGVGQTAMNDAMLLKESAYLLLKKYFEHKPYYVNLVELWHEAGLRITLGQSLDTLNSLKFDNVTLDLFNTIVKYKIADCFYFPIATALYMAGISDPKVHRTARNVLLEIGNLFQVQNDYNDCFGDPAITGSIGTDIEEGKCTWLVVTAFKLGDPDDLAVIRENYGRNEPRCVAKVKCVYEKLQLPAVFKKHEEERCKYFNELIDQLEPDLPTKIFRELVNTCYKS